MLSSLAVLLRLESSPRTERQRNGFGEAATREGRNFALDPCGVFSFFFGGEVDVFTDTAILLVGGFRCSS